MYRVFNMGIGFVVILPKTELEKATNILKAQHQQYYQIGVIRKGSGIVVYNDSGKVPRKKASAEREG